ncbi:MAG: SAM-dependent DNA methyltransferase [Candidatus Cloacimonetes bacterium]|nr:SAM-dependent DNA methyltransferase [Candidatus Cloacimonadota bacterium]
MQVKSRQRVVDHGEVFTAKREINAMLDLVKQETERIESRFLEPACGSGNFLAEVLERKLNVVKARYEKSQTEYERYAVLAVSSIYGIDILEDNVQECQDRLFEIFNNHYLGLYKEKCKEDCLKSVRFILKKNIILGDALDFTNPITKKYIVLPEWSAVNGNMLKRRDYMFKFLVEKKFQYTLFNDEGDEAGIDEPVKDYPLVHFLRLADEE